MRWLTLHVRARRVPAAVGAAAASMVAMWLLAVAFTDGHPGLIMVTLTVLLLVVTLTATLGGPDAVLERTAALPWAPRRVAHLLIAFTVVVGLPLLTTVSGAGFGPVELVLRNAAGLLGLTALSAPLIGAGRAWFLPLGWTLIATLYPVAGHPLGEVLTWQGQSPASVPAAATASVLAIAGLLEYALAGPAAPAPAEAAS